MTTIMLTPMNRFRFVRSIKDSNSAVYADKIFDQISFTPEQLEDLKSLHRYAKTLHRISENQCNGHPKIKTEYRYGKMYQYSVEDEAWRDRDEKREASYNQKIAGICEKHAWVFELQGDPRGWPLKLIINDMDCSVLVNY